MGKKLYITTAIPYANSKPHIGNALDYLLADIWARYHRQLGKEVRFQAGTDEHGNKISAKAQAEGLDPISYVNQTHLYFKEIMNKIGAQYTDFIRTTDSHHIQAVQYIWKKLSPYIYKGTYEGWYSVGEESFVSDKVAAANNGISPDHGVPYERLSEENYYFRLTHFVPQIRSAIESNEIKIFPESRKKEVLNLLNDGIEDLSVSRPRKNLAWGVSVPGDDNQVIYVWIDALSNYITVLGYPDNESWRDYWPANVQVVGKDILRFHAIIWPAILMALGLPLPKQILVHGHIGFDGKKMSKSLGNVVSPNEVIDTYGADAFRYYFSRHIPTLDDGDFTWEKFEKAYNNELGNDLGNLVQRVAKMVLRYQAGVVGELNRGEHDIQLYRDAMDEMRFSDAIDQVWGKIRATNQYLEQVKPWEVAKNKDDPESTEHLSDILQDAVGSIMQIADLLVPFLPEASSKIKAIFAEGVVSSSDPIFPKIYIHTKDPRTEHGR
ncbi:MAG: methionine--tRNA ligase [Candidatus Saccharibacteria bacterium]|jgi:methionine--tRNA ligase|nr:methionine--tRNA ligase [Candidatus Nanosynbacter sp.]